MKTNIWLFILTVLFAGAGCSAPDLVWVAKTGATAQRQWTCFDNPELDQRKTVYRTLNRQEEIEENEADDLRGGGGQRLFLVTTGYLFPPKAEREGEIRTINQRLYQLKHRYYIYHRLTTREDLITEEVRYFKTSPETTNLLERIGPVGGDPPEQPPEENATPE
ncbi:MAG: hypothetical protein ACYS8W_16615 [Planctomycetota bacterium]|jgi:hypothetical protein